jgi:cytosine/adenosine deaminase-related metal-dependent hydrolase
MKEILAGKWLLTYDGVVRGYLRIEEDSVSEICLGEAPPDSLKAIVVPGFVNAHTHIGDSVAFPAPKGSVADIVGPPDGYKHRILRSTPRKSKIDAMKESIRLMSRTGTSAFVDFRESGLEGLKEFSEALTNDSPSSTVLGRPSSVVSKRSEVDALLDACDGIGLSACRDWPMDFLRMLSRAAKSKKKIFALHASEVVREELGQILDLGPSFLVHMTRALESDFAHCAQEGLPIVVCPRSNEFFGLCPDIPMMLRSGVTVGLGTDNCMVSKPDILEEIKAAYRLSKMKGGITPLETVRLASFSGRKVLNANGNITTEIDVKDDLSVIGVGGDDPLRDLVTMGRSENIKAVVRGGKVRWRS